MKIGIKVGDIMTRNFVSVKPETNLIDCAREMIKKKVGSLILRNGQKLEGIITEKDIVWALTKRGNLNKIRAIDIAPRKVASIKPNADLSEALQRMNKLKFRRLPVTINGDVIGMLTLKDILRIQPDLLSNLGEVDHIREESEKLRRLKGTRWSSEGLCEECGNSGLLYKVDSRLICESCRQDM